MAYHFSANQFEDQYDPRKLGNWEYPKWYPERPRQRFKSTKIIADDCGRLLEGVKRGNAWGNYVGTWDLPKRITREYVNKLVAPPERLVKSWEKKKSVTEEQQSQQEPEALETPEEPEELKSPGVSRASKTREAPGATGALRASGTREAPGAPGTGDTLRASGTREAPGATGALRASGTREAPGATGALRASGTREAPGAPGALRASGTREAPGATGAPEIPEAAPQQEKTDSLPTIDSNSAQKSYQKRNKSSSALDLRPRATKLEPLVSLQRKNENLHKIKPGSLDEKIKNILESVQEKQDKQITPPEFLCKEIKALPKQTKRKVDANQPSEEPKDEAKKNYEFLNCLDEHLNKYETAGPDFDEEKQDIDFSKFEKQEEDTKMEKVVKTPEKKTLEPLKNGYTGFQIAKRFHDENLRHKPLPDVIDDPVFKALNSTKQPNAIGALNMESAPAAIGWKPYSAPRPTECSKLKVFRPKTGAEKQKLQKDSRPKTGGSFYKKHFLPIDLAICWDLKPDDPSDEPKRSPHIDGSNGSVAPAVFTMIRPTESEETEQSIPGSSQALAEKIIKGIDENNAATVPSQLNGKPRSPMSLTTNKEAILTCVKTSRDDAQKRNGGTPESLNSISPNAAEYARRHPKTAWTKEDTSKALSDRLQYLQNEKNGIKKNGFSRSPSEASQLSKKKHHQSTPNLVCDGSHCGTEKSSPGSVKISDHSKNRSCGSEINDENKFEILSGDKNEKTVKNIQKKRNCSASKKSNLNCIENREKPEFKSAFKAGVPRSESTNSGSSSAAKSYKVPKMRLPYAKRSYSIGTLAPPFSLWRESNGQEYPEHWRLASVYQHSYKPINFRKRPLLASVYQ